MKFVGYITVRLNSKRVPKKSIKKIGGESLVSRAISTLNKVKDVSEVILYCSQEGIKKYINPNCKYTFIKRPEGLDGDKVTFSEILETIVDRIDTNYIVFLCCTSPFLKPETINEMIKKIKSKKYDSAFTAYELKSFSWFKGKPLNYSLNNVPRTQDLEPVLQETSALYIFSKGLFKKYKRRIGFKPYIKVVDKFESWDIDDLEDLKFARIIAKIIK